MTPDARFAVVSIPTARTDLPRRTLPVRAVVVHTTGTGIVEQALRKGRPPLDFAAAHYAKASSFASHYLIGYEGEVVGTVPEAVVAYHAGVPTAHRGLYALGRAVWPRYVGGTDRGGPQTHYGDWLARWPDLLSPLDLVTGKVVNGSTVGVDLLAPVPGVAFHPEEQVAMAARLVADILRRHSLVASRPTVLRHADVDPFSRSTKRGGWDPPREAFTRLCRLLGFAAWPEEPVAEAVA